MAAVKAAASCTVPPPRLALSASSTRRTPRALGAFSAYMVKPPLKVRSSPVNGTGPTASSAFGSSESAHEASVNASSQVSIGLTMTAVFCLAFTAAATVPSALAMPAFHACTALPASKAGRPLTRGMRMRFSECTCFHE